MSTSFQPLRTEPTRNADAAPQSLPGSISEQELRGIVDAIPHVIVVLAPDGSPIYANKWMIDYIGLTDEEVRQPGVRARIFHPDDLPGLEKQRREAMSRGLLQRSWDPVDRECASSRRMAECTSRSAERDPQRFWKIVHSPGMYLAIPIHEVVNSIRSRG